MASLKEQISFLTNPTPIFQDPEDDEDEVSKAKVVDYTGDDIEEFQVSSLRKRASKLLSEEDQKYAGRKISRKSYTERSDEEELSDVYSSSEESEEEDNDDLENRESTSNEDDLDLENFQAEVKKMGRSKGTKLGSSDYGTGDSDMEEVDEDTDSEDGDDDDVSEDEEDTDKECRSSSQEDSDEEGTGIEKASDGDVLSFSRTDIEEEIEKGQAAKAQLGLWDSLLESRIKLQRALVSVNQLPQPETWATFCDTGSDDINKAVKQSENLVKTFGDTLLKLQTALLLQNPETKYIVTDNQKYQTGNDNREDTTSEKSQSKKQVLKRSAVDDYSETVSKRHKLFHSYRNNTIQKWNDKTRLSSGKLSSKSFNAFDLSATKQIDQILSDKDRLIKRTQLKRNTYKIIGKPEVEETTQEAESIEKEALPNRDHLKNYDEEIFDDDDFYHQLLRELIEKKTSDVNDPVSLSRHWLEVQKARNKVKKKVDTKASKGRKIRYDIHPKTVNFMAPMDHSSWNDESRNDLFMSLFGQRYQVKENVQ